MRSEPALAVHADGAAVAAAAAALVGAELEAAVAVRGRATLAVSGGRTPLTAFARLATLPLPWSAIDVLQVDERCAPAGHADRNSVQLARAFGPLAAAHADRFHWLPLDDTADARAAALAYSETLTRLAGSPPVIDVLQLGLGTDGHTASLFPGQALELVTPFVGLAPPALGWPRVTLTLPVLNAARRIVWIVTGADKRVPLRGLLAGDPGVVGSGVRREGAFVLADRAAADATNRAATTR
jgi:6-phosphogluconolactonase